jgi:hypothetical protein
MFLYHLILWVLSHGHPHGLRCLCPIKFYHPHHHNPFGLPPGYDPGGPIKLFRR